MGSTIKLDKEGKHRQCLREITWTLVVVFVCCLWHIISAWTLNGKGWYFLGMPSWFSISTLGSLVILFIGIRILLKRVFIDFDYDEENES